jgi:hypothetical protein
MMKDAARNIVNGTCSDLRILRNDPALLLVRKNDRRREQKEAKSIQEVTMKITRIDRTQAKHDPSRANYFDGEVKFQSLFSIYLV